MMHLLIIDDANQDLDALFADLRRAVEVVRETTAPQRRLWIVAYDDDTSPALDASVGGGVRSALRTIDTHRGCPLALEETVQLLRQRPVRPPEAEDSDESTPVRLRAGSIDIDRGTGQCWRDGVEVELSDREFAMLEYLMLSNGAVASKFDLMALCRYDAGIQPSDHFDTTCTVCGASWRRRTGGPPSTSSVVAIGSSPTSPDPLRTSADKHDKHVTRQAAPKQQSTAQHHADLLVVRVRPHVSVGVHPKSPLEAMLNARFGSRLRSKVETL